MNFDELIRSRYSVRKFKNEQVEQEKVNAILEAGRLAPTAVNYQPQRILVVNTKEGLAKVADCTRFYFNAPLVFIVCYDNTRSWKRAKDNKEEGEVDASIVATHMMLKITDLGLGSTWVGSFDYEKLREKFEIPDNIIPVAMLPTGYPHEESSPHINHEKRFDIDTTTFYNSFTSQEK